MVGFCHPAVTKLAPSTTKRFFTSWLWHHLLSTLFFGSSTHAARAYFVNAVARRVHLIGLADDLPAGIVEDFLDSVGRVFA